MKMKDSNLCATRRNGLRASLVIVMLLTGCTQTEEPKKMTTTTNEPSMLMNKPYVTALIEMADCHFYVEINGVMINRGAQPVTVEIPINHWLRSGENNIQLFLYTPEESKTIAPNAHCSVSLQVRSDDAPSSTAQVVSRLVYSGKEALVGTGTEASTAPGKYDSRRDFIADHGGDVEVGKVSQGPMPDSSDEGVVLTQKIVMPLPFPEWAFFHSNELPPDVDKMSDAEFDQYFKSLHAQYQRIYDALKRKDVDSILPLFEERNREMDIAMFYPLGTFRQKIGEALKDALNDPELELLDIGGTRIDGKGVSLSVYTFSNRKLVQLLRNGFGSAIVFNFRNAEASEQYDIIFRRQNGQWIITR